MALPWLAVLLVSPSEASAPDLDGAALGVAWALPFLGSYLVFFELAGGDAGRLMTTGASTLAAISAGAVFVGANSSIGNAPNSMVYAIARRSGVRMPSFFGYLLWSSVVLLPVFGLATVVFFGS